MKRLILAFTLFLGTVALAQQDVSVTWMTGANTPSVQFAQKTAQRYMDANPHTIGGTDYNVTIEVVPGPDSATDRLSLYLQYFEARSSEVDVMDIDVIWPGDLAAHLANLYDYEGFEAAVEDFFPAIVENNTVNGELVGLPYFTDAGLLYYRQDLLDEYGFDGPPETWQELEQMAQTIQDGEREGGNPDFWGYVWQGNAYEGLTCDALEWVASNGGGSIIEPDGTISINNERAIAAVEMAANWVGTISPDGVTGYQEEDARGTWQSGNAAFMRNWPYAYVPGQDADSAIRDKFGVTTLPAGDSGAGAATLGGWQLAVNRYSPNPEVAADVVLHLGSYDEQLARAIEVSNLPTIEAVYEDQELLDSDVGWFNALLPVFRNAVARPSTITAPQYGETSRLFFSAIHDVLTGDEDASTALAILELDLEALHPDLELGEP
ncbi:MAG: ABC transporter substrate-binding protein [Trueperaceae bacterium]